MDTGYEAVLFDAGNTLVRVTPSVGAIYAETAARHGVDVAADVLERAFRQVWAARCQDLRRSSSWHTSEEAERRWWREIVAATFRNAGQTGGFRNGFEAFFDELYALFAEARCWQVFDDVRPALARLAEAGVRCAVVSNWDSRLRRLLEALNLARWFEFVLTSAQAGYSKPDPRIFQEALARLGVAADRAVYVGDSFEDDVIGARNAGLRALLLDRSGAQDSRTHTLASLNDLPARLRLSI